MHNKRAAKNDYNSVLKMNHPHSETATINGRLELRTQSSYEQQQENIYKFINRITKRFVDIVFSMMVMITVFPIVFPLVMLLIVLDSKGGIFFIQPRNGFNNKPFGCIKFRTMHVTDKVHHLKSENNEHRITRIGKFIRISGIDELPQFINVLKGDMSIVGPRPYMMSDNEIFAGSMSFYYKRHFIKPGITGLAQVNGYKGDTSNFARIKARTRLDLIYVEHQNMFFDMIIMLKTVKLLFKETFGLIRNK